MSGFRRTTRGGRCDPGGKRGPGDGGGQKEKGVKSVVAYIPVIRANRARRTIIIALRRRGFSRRG